MELYYTIFPEPTTVGARSKARDIFGCSSPGIMDSNPTRGMNISVLGALRESWSPVHGFLPTVYSIRNFIINYEWEQARKPNASRWKKYKKKKKSFSRINPPPPNQLIASPSGVGLTTLWLSFI
jgi:hypothetical protein